MDNKNLLILAVLGAGAYLVLKPKSAATTTSLPAGATAYLPATSFAPTVVSDPAATPDVIAVAVENGLDVATTLAVMRYDATLYGHPDNLSTQYFLGNKPLFATALAAYKARGGNSSGSAPTTAPTTAPSTASVTSDGAPHRGTADDIALSNFSAADVSAIQSLSNAFHLVVEDVVDVISFQGRRDRKGWSQIAKEYAANPSWFRDVAIEVNASNPKYRINIS